MVRVPALLCALFALSALAAEKHEHEGDDMQAHARLHREFAELHLKMAECLEAGRGEEQCARELKQACRGKASGPNCGIRHEHHH